MTRWPISDLRRKHLIECPSRRWSRADAGLVSDHKFILSKIIPFVTANQCCTHSTESKQQTLFHVQRLAYWFGSVNCSWKRCKRICGADENNSVGLTDPGQSNFGNNNNSNNYCNIINKNYNYYDIYMHNKEIDVRSCTLTDAGIKTYRSTRTQR